MDTIKSKLGKGGLLLAAMGIMSIVLSFFNYNIRLLSWIDNWGTTTGWIIKIILIAGGGALFFLFGSGDEDDDAIDSHLDAN